MDSEPAISVCATCRHMAQRPKPQHFQPAQYSRSAILEADLAWQEWWQKIGRSEQLRYHARQPFTYEPYTYAWCRYFTATNAAEAGVSALDPVTGRAVTVYALCYQMNDRGQCAHHAPLYPEQDKR
jgi:hypothetical protein